MEKGKVLYIDDEEINLMLFEAVLAKKYKVFTALDGESGLKILKENADIDIVFSDMKMPVMDGISFIQKAKVDHPQVPFYLLTGFDISDEIQKYINDELIVNCLRKPFEMDVIIHEIEKQIKA